MYYLPFFIMLSTIQCIAWSNPAWVAIKHKYERGLGLTSAIISRMDRTTESPRTRPMVIQSGARRMPDSRAIPFWMMYRGVEGKNGPSSEHWAFSAITRMYCVKERERNVTCNMKGVSRFCVRQDVVKHLINIHRCKSCNT